MNTAPNFTSSFSSRFGVRVACLLLSVSLIACQNVGSQNSMPTTAAERQMLDDQKRLNDTIFGGAAVGAGIGALLGVAIVAIRGGDKKDYAAGAAIGGVVGGAAGAADGYQTGKKEQAGRDNIRATQAETDKVHQANAALQRYVDNSSQVLAEGQARLNTLKRDIAARKLSTNDAKQARAREERNIASMNDTLEKARSNRAQFAEAQSKSPGNKSAGLDSQIQLMDSQIHKLESNLAAYNEALRVSGA